MLAGRSRIPSQFIVSRAALRYTRWREIWFSDTTMVNSQIRVSDGNRRKVPSALLKSRCCNDQRCSAKSCRAFGRASGILRGGSFIVHLLCVSRRRLSYRHSPRNLCAGFKRRIIDSPFRIAFGERQLISFHLSTYRNARASGLEIKSHYAVLIQLSRNNIAKSLAR